MLTISQYQTRPMTEADINQVVEIERESFPTTWPHTAYRRELANQMARYLVVVDSVHDPVIPEPERRSFLDLFRKNEPAPPTTDYIAGYVGVWLMVDEAHIVSIAVRQAYRGRGLGEMLLAEALELARRSRLEIVTLEVRRSNVVAQNLYEKYRFLKVGVRRRYYSDNGEDAVIMSTPPIQDDAYTSYLAYMHEQWSQRWSGG